VRGLIAASFKVVTQAALDHGQWDMAWRYFPGEDPVKPGVRDPFPPTRDEADPFDSLAEMEEVSAALAYNRDMAALAKARSERLRVDHSTRPPAAEDSDWKGAGRNRTRPKRTDQDGAKPAGTPKKVLINGGSWPQSGSGGDLPWVAQEIRVLRRWYAAPRSCC
jgi:hypothetical protein